MATEIEHKYLVKNDTYRSLATESWPISQGYLSRDPERTVRVRIKGDRGYLTVKGINRGAVRSEFEYEISKDDAETMLGMCVAPIVSKTRYIVPFGGHIWEVDEFSGALKGLVTAEIELNTEAESYDMPDFAGRNVTGDPAFYNSNLSTATGLADLSC